MDISLELGKKVKKLKEFIMRIKKRLFAKLCECKEPTFTSPKKSKKKGRPLKRRK
jgi:hypothetical protein